jgi:hypothetical protein
MTSYSFEKLSKNNLHDLIPIYQDAFGIEVSEEFLFSKQQTFFTGFKNVGFIAYDELQKPAAFYGVYPCFIDYQGKKYLVAQSGDTMTHSNHLGKGLFTILARKTYDYCKENGFHLVFGFPNQNSYTGFTKKLDWVHFDNVYSYRIRVRGLSWFRINQFFKFSTKKHKEWCHKIISRENVGTPFVSSCTDSETPVVLHDIDFFKYKSYGSNYLIEINGVGVWLKMEPDYLIIGDIENCNEQCLNEVITKLKRLARLMFIPYLRFLGSRNTWLANYFAKHGELMDSTYAIGGINFTDQIPLEKMKFTAADNDTF